MTRLITLDLNDYYFDPCAHTHNHFTALFPGLPGWVYLLKYIVLDSFWFYLCCSGDWHYWQVTVTHYVEDSNQQSWACNFHCESQFCTVFKLILGHIAVLRTLMRPIVTDRVAWFVGLSVTQWALQKQLDRSRCRLGCGLGWPREPCIRWGSRCRDAKGQFWGGKGSPIAKYRDTLVSCAKTA